MFLDVLPTELLRMVVRRLSPRERIPLRRTCRRFCSLVETEGVLPFNPARIYIDFWRQIIAVFMHEEENDNYISLANGKVRSGESFPGHPRCPAEFYRVVLDLETMCSIRERFFDVGDNWTTYVDDYLRRLNKQFNTVEYSRMIIILGEEIPPQLEQLSIRVDAVVIQAEHPRWIDRYLPDSLISWPRKVSKGSETSIIVCFSPMGRNQLKMMARIQPMLLNGFLDDDGAMQLLEMFANRTLPNLEFWFFKLHQDSTRFLSALKTRYNVEPTGQTYIGRRIMSGRNGLFLKESDCLYVCIASRKFLRSF